MFDSINDLGAKLAATGYFIDPVMTQVIFLAAKLQKPLLLEGPAGSGKTQLAVSVAAAGIGQDGRMSLKMDGGRAVELDSVKNPHLDHGYAVTSHSSQGQTADRVLIHVDTELGAKDLLNNRMAYVAVSRGAYDAQIFTNDREKLGAALGHDVSHSSAHAPEMKPEQKQEQAVTPQREIAPKQEQGEDFGLGL